MLADLTAITLNEEGFMTDPNQWTKEIAEVIAKQEGIESLNGDHWKIIDFCRETGMASGKSPTLPLVKSQKAYLLRKVDFRLMSI